MDQLHAPASSPAFRVDEAASEVRLVNSNEPDEARHLGAEALNLAASGSGKAQPARFSALVTVDRGGAGSAPIAWILSPLAGILWIPSVYLSTDVTLTLEIGARTYRGEGSDTAFFTMGGVFLSPDHDSEWRATVHNAFQEALIDAFEKAEEADAKKADGQGSRRAASRGTR